jgi:hypothetical protein
MTAIIRNEGKGKRFYGLHFYPGTAEYSEADGSAYRVFLNENTLRKMDASFEGCPVFLQHVDGVEEDIDKLNGETDGWVVRSFYNEIDGKHWVEFVVVTEKALSAINNGWQLSNCYVPTTSGSGGMWNGITYAKEITGGEYEHLAIVPNPRYEESVIMSPEKFKKYNEEKTLELKRLSNEKDKSMKLNIFKRTKVENSTDFDGLVVQLPKSGREVALVTLVAEADAAEEAKGKANVANDLDTVSLKNGEKMTVGDMVAKHQAMCDEIEEMKKKNISFDKDDDEAGEADHVKENDDDDEDDKKKKANEDEDKEDKETKKNDLAVAKAKAKEKAERLRNAERNVEPAPRIDLSMDKVARGKARYGS